MRRLARFVGGEAALAAALLAVVAVMSATPPGLHEAPVWPFAFRLTTAALENAPALTTRALVGRQVAVIGLAPLPPPPPPPPRLPPRPRVRPRRRPPGRGRAAARGAGAARPGAPGPGPAPAGRGLPRPPAVLRAPHTAQHPAGDLFWWITHGIPRAGMPPFGATLSEEQRWDPVNCLRALSSGHAARALGPAVGPEPPWLVAPDFTFAVGPTPARALKEY